MQHMLIVEDDDDLRRLLVETFSTQYLCVAVPNLSQAYQAVAAAAFSIAIIDRGLPDGDGIELIEYLHDLSFKTKVVALTSQGTVGARISGLEAGADEYLPKPFSLAELRLRIKRLQQMDKQPIAHVITAGELALHPETGVVQLGRREVQLRKKEAALLHCLLRYQNQVVTRERLIADVWNGADEYPSMTTLDVYIRRIRVLLKEYSDMIQTVRGFGYKLTL